MNGVLLLCNNNECRLIKDEQPQSNVFLNQQLIIQLVWGRYTHTYLIAEYHSWPIRVKYFKEHSNAAFILFQIVGDYPPAMSHRLIRSFLFPNIFGEILCTMNVNFSNCTYVSFTVIICVISYRCIDFVLVTSRCRPLKTHSLDRKICFSAKKP